MNFEPGNLVISKQLQKQLKWSGFHKVLQQFSPPYTHLISSDVHVRQLCAFLLGITKSMPAVF